MSPMMMTFGYEPMMLFQFVGMEKVPIESSVVENRECLREHSGSVSNPRQYTLQSSQKHKAGAGKTSQQF